MSDKLKYEAAPEMSRREIKEAFQGGESERIRIALISALCTEDGLSIQNWCLKFISHPEGIVRNAAVQVLGSLVIVKLLEVDLSKCIAAVEKARVDPDKEVRTAASDALEDVLHAMKLRGVS